MDLLKVEIARHRDKLIKLSKLSVDQVDTNIDLFCSRIKFVDTIILSNEQIESAIEITKDIDINDSLFVALASYLNAKLWTGDIKLAKGLTQKRIDLVITTNDVYFLYKKSMN